MIIDIRGSAPRFEVFDMPTSIAFYGGVLGFEIASTSSPRSDDVARCFGSTASS